MTKMAAMPIYGKNLQNLQNQKAYDLETLYEHLGLWPFIVCSYDDPRLTMTYFTARSNLVSYAVTFGKILNGRNSKCPE